MEETDLQLQLKKRARRRLLGAMVFATLVALFLPMLMEHEPRPMIPDLDIRIPGQDDKPFVPRLAPASAEVPQEQAVDKPEKTAAVPLEKRQADLKPSLETSAKLMPSPSERTEEALPETRRVEPVAEKSTEPVANREHEREAKRAADLLAGKSGATGQAVVAVVPKAASGDKASGGEYLILIGAFANEANVRQIRSKLSELNIKTFTEQLDSPQGKKIRVRAGPFSHREAAEKALEKMKRVGISGLVSAK